MIPAVVYDFFIQENFKLLILSNVTIMLVLNFHTCSTKWHILERHGMAWHKKGVYLNEFRAIRR